MQKHNANLRLILLYTWDTSQDTPWKNITAKIHVSSRLVERHIHARAL